MTTAERLPEHPEDRKERLASIREARRTIGPFYRKHWRRFVALVQTYPDGEAHELLDKLREDYWAMHHPVGPPPAPPSAAARLGAE